MSMIFKATCQNGQLILEEKLPDSLEGKQVKIMLIDNDDQEIEQKKAEFFKLASRHSFPLPDDYKFNRDELYDE